MLVGSWWFWLAAGLVGGGLILGKATKFWRASLRRELIAYLRKNDPTIVVLREEERELVIRTGESGEGTVRLDRLFAAASQLRSSDSAAREQLFKQTLETLHEGSATFALNAERDHQRIMPRLVTESRLRQLRAETSGDPLPALPSGVAGLSIVLVLDGANSVAYLTERQLEDLALTSEDALQLAKENLCRSFEAAIVRRAIDEGTLNVVKTFDTFDAARLLLLPQFLRHGEELAALIPDRDTLVVTRVPANRDWSALRKLAKAKAGDPLWPEPLLVTSAGISQATLK